MSLLLTALLTGAAPAADASADVRTHAAAVGRHTGGAAKSPHRHGTSATAAPPSTSTSPSASPSAPGANEADEANEAAFGTHDLYGDDSGYGTGSGSGTLEDGYAPSDGVRPTTAATGGVSPVLPLGAGMTLIGLGLALIALRLRRA
ncbi:hypothetical protein [Streptomyces nanshensis]|uniref:hypothetical protein n=1 Tax=Streptomyces nanshensis TaxID=518642 RepID=UPI00114D2F37|nr:hypothetical protein [Streptomyces nanshensis]